MGQRKTFTCLVNRVGEVAVLQWIGILKYILFVHAGTGLITSIVIIIMLALIIIALLVYCLFWKRRQNRDSDTEFPFDNRKKPPISLKELGMCIHWEIFSKIHCRNLNYFMPLLSFYTPWKHRKTRGLLMFSEVIERNQWHEMGCPWNKKHEKFR